MNDIHYNKVNDEWPGPNETYAGQGNITDGWFIGGFSVSNSNAGTSFVQRINFANDGVIASLRGNNTNAVMEPSSSGNTTDGWTILGRYSGSVSVTNFTRIIYSSDTSTAVTKGRVSASSTGQSSNIAKGNATDSWIMYSGSAPSTITYVSRLTYATDTNVAANKGTPNNSGQDNGTIVNGNSTDAWRNGGGAGASIATSYVRRLTYANDSTGVIARGTMSRANGYFGFSGNSTDGWMIGGFYPPGTSWSSAVMRVTYSNDTVTSDTSAAFISSWGGASSGIVSTWNNIGSAGAPTYTGVFRYDFSNSNAVMVGDLVQAAGRNTAT